LVDPGTYWKPSDDDWGYITCTNPKGPNMASALQEFGPNGVPVGLPVVVCPSEGGRFAPPPGPPPTASEVWAAVPLPEPVLEVNPSVVGLTQLPSWFWLENVGQSVDVTVEVAGYKVVAEAVPLSYEWSFGDGTGTASCCAGIQSQPSAVHTYRYQGTYPVTVVVTYVGRYSFTTPGGTQTVPLGEYAGTRLEDQYRVQEVRSVLVPQGAEQ
jgi:hypothetical protein